MDNKVELVVEGKKKADGQITGSGDLTLNVSDLSKCSLMLDYTHEDKVTLHLASEVGFKLAADRSLTIGGGVDYSFLEDQLTGNVKLQFIVSKEVALTFKQDFSKSGMNITATFRLTF
jgi:hypothetical protein